jgi:hypothetical protein
MVQRPIKEDSRLGGPNCSKSTSLTKIAHPSKAPILAAVCSVATRKQNPTPTAGQLGKGGAIAIVIPIPIPFVIILLLLLLLLLFPKQFVSFSPNWQVVPLISMSWQTQ